MLKGSSLLQSASMWSLNPNQRILLPSVSFLAPQFGETASFLSLDLGLAFSKESILVESIATFEPSTIPILMAFLTKHSKSYSNEGILDSLVKIY